MTSHNRNIMKKEKNIQEIRIHYNRPRVRDMVQVTRSHKAQLMFRKFIDPDMIDYKEFFFVMLLNSAKYMLGICQVGVGSDKGVIFSAKEVFQLALTANANSIIVCHNHPSGNLTPSESDIQITKQLIAIGKLLDIELDDHIIISSEWYFSFGDEERI